MKAIIPAAGLGTRFLPWSKACPKEMLPLLDKPVIQWAIEEAVKAGITDFIIVVSKGKEAIVNYFSPDMFLEKHLQESNKHERMRGLNQLLNKIDITFVYQKGPYGNASPVISAQKYIGPKEPFLVIWGDEFIFSDPPWIKQLTDAYKKHHLSVISGLRVPKEVLSTKGVGEFASYADDLMQIKGIVEKPAPGKAPSDISLTGAYLLTPDFWPYLERLKPGKGGELWLTDAILQFCREHTLLAKVIANSHFYDVGTKKGYYQAWESVLKAKNLVQ